MLHVHVGTAQDFKAERTEEVFSVFVDGAEMVLYIWEEWWSVVADLWAETCQWDKQDITGNDKGSQRKEISGTWQPYGISPGLWLSFMCSNSTCSVSKANSQILQLAEMELKQQKGVKP